MNADWGACLNESEYAEFVEAEQDLVDFRNARHYYWLKENVKAIPLENEPPQPGQIGSRSGFSLKYSDENTLIWDDAHVYKFFE